MRRVKESSIRSTVQTGKSTGAVDGANGAMRSGVKAPFTLMVLAILMLAKRWHVRGGLRSSSTKEANLLELSQLRCGSLMHKPLASLRFMLSEG